MDERTPTDLAPDAETSPPAGFKRPRRSETLLVVDDDPWVLRVTVDFLVGEEGYDVLQATGGEEAMRFFRLQSKSRLLREPNRPLGAFRIELEEVDA